MTIRIKISKAIDNEYANRLPDFLPLDRMKVGWVELSEKEAQAMLADAEFNSDLKAQDVGPYGMPLPTFNAYRALAKQVRKALEAAK